MQVGATFSEYTGVPLRAVHSPRLRVTLVIIAVSCRALSDAIVAAERRGAIADYFTHAEAA